MHCKTLAMAVALATCLTEAVWAAPSDLMDIYKEAYLKDPVVLQSKATRDAAFEAIDEATAALLPQIDVVGSLTAATNSSQGESVDNRNAQGGINLSQAIWRHSAWVSRTIAEKNAAQQDLVYNDALQNLIIRVSNAYFGVLNAEDTLTFAKANQEALRTQLNEATRRFLEGGNPFGAHMLFVLNAAGVQLFSTTALSFRLAAGSASPADIVLPTFLATLASAAFAVCLLFFTAPNRRNMRHPRPLRPRARR